METSNRPSRPDRLEIFGNDWEDPDNHMETRLKQPRRRPQQERHKFAYLTMKNNSFARFARAFLIFVHFADILVLSST